MTKVPLNTDPAVVTHGGKVAIAKRLEPLRQRSAGRMVLVGAPVKPAENWECGTDLVWPLLDKAILKEAGKGNLIGRIFLCRHQIIVGD